MTRTALRGKGSFLAWHLLGNIIVTSGRISLRVFSKKCVYTLMHSQYESIYYRSRLLGLLLCVLYSFIILSRLLLSILLYLRCNCFIITRTICCNEVGDGRYHVHLSVQISRADTPLLGVLFLHTDRTGHSQRPPCHCHTDSK